ncbi:uncharacterized protein LOC133805509 [Humulus lupulus]|uniref:uncharacterized protein LOC133805509 n=1 Tax=Humulus lupulus TaxID=3486 RepID=UPI002B413AD3|nr:uncharacterized protein LOC133805509 [Humulus lupulus]
MLGYLKEKIHKRIEGWEDKLLSRAGKEILIKSVAQPLSSYAMNVFLLPLELCHDIEVMMNRFCWANSSKKRKEIHWMCWDRLTKPKTVGGKGFCSLRDFNLALLSKQGWRFLSNPDSLASRIFKARYFPNNSFLEAGLGKSVSSLLISGVKAWDVDILTDLFNDRDRELITNIPLSVNVEQDTWHWSKEVSRLFTVQSAYNLLKYLHGQWYTDNNSGFWRKLWQLKIPPEVRNFIWRAVARCLPTRVDLRLKHVDVDIECPKARNDLIWKHTKPLVDQVLTMSKSCLHQSSQLARWGAECKERWTKPNDGIVKINVDVSVHEAHNIFGFSCMARDSNGHVIEALVGGEVKLLQFWVKL